MFEWYIWIRIQRKLTQWVSVWMKERRPRVLVGTGSTVINENRLAKQQKTDTSKTPASFLPSLYTLCALRLPFSLFLSLSTGFYHVLLFFMRLPVTQSRAVSHPPTLLRWCYFLSFVPYCFKYINLQLLFQHSRIENWSHFCKGEFQLSANGCFRRPPPRVWTSAWLNGNILCCSTAVVSTSIHENRSAVCVVYACSVRTWRIPGG